MSESDTSEEPITRTLEEGATGAQPDPSLKHMPTLDLSWLKPLQTTEKAPVCFQDEFMQNYDNFSQSWRDQIDKGQRNS